MVYVYRHKQIFIIDIEATWFSSRADAESSLFVFNAKPVFCIPHTQIGML